MMNMNMKIFLLYLFLILSSLYQIKNSTLINRVGVAVGDDDEQQVMEQSNIHNDDSIPSSSSSSSATTTAMMASRTASASSPSKNGNMTTSIRTETKVPVTDAPATTTLTTTTIDNESDNTNTNIKRGIFLISMGKKAAKTTLVERFIWSARNIGNYSDYIILVTDANEQRYEYEYTEAEADLLLPTNSTATATNTNNNATATNNNSNNNNLMKNDPKIIIFYTQDKSITTIKHKKFKSTTMNSKVYKTYIYDYLKLDERLQDIELLYYLDIDIIVGNELPPLFQEYETLYQIHNTQHNEEEEAQVITTNTTTGSASTTTKETTTKPTTASRTAKIYFFEGNGSQEIQGGQFILRIQPSSKSKSSNTNPNTTTTTITNNNNNNNFISSEICLERWRTLMQQNRTERLLKDQVSLTMMLQEQRHRQEKLESRNTSSSSSSSDTDTGKDVNGKRKRRRGNKNPKIECEIILMKQNTKYIQFPETINITERYNDIIAMQQQQEQIERNDGSIEQQQLQRPTTKNNNTYEYATLVHFRNSANVMRDVDEKQLQYYIKDILRFDISTNTNNTNNNSTTTNNTNNNNDGDDPYGFSSKMLFNR
ncbi:hypothetical protein FRACYDRAFT_244355 [Fragilariopsis cylindrus CCMP1102]|uniref:Nucleotide-diphospho-sugar transferase domain-containing protein n=1 Tax=Fragilariopsis cylindrus CCMP1102 TaxID=635003 RepID=A0A1E7F250_9STRA|nr:hypothetical protein FRACYDRAFT_244355 [Fragilariopsis cylindrus CCMP1102]|eukprot:OEU12095.1 hypothetical protein FRACYDRAFT_244355 [Fragilariopsis cylindrus CCMP1102]